ncbi:TPA: hypothetical protein N0F65_009250 [Lagenidium giganteum]|uniref:PiggyBac transposable element-derived protein domain-containing protein n=1 Tax=Lagenidium giganteum TaxID=4803 RepID=A0AAV2YK52_9STRA|nr:TPA: hypothetical protein N0F65_009250 [Lagenidium giganteum]
MAWFAFSDGLHPTSGGLRQYWASEDTTGCVDTCRNFRKRFYMSRNRFVKLTSAFSLCDPDITSDDPWMPVNRRRRSQVHAGDFLCVDESMVQRYGKESKYHHLGLPHKTKIPLKPVSQGAEIKTIADAQSGVILGLELVEGKERQRQKQYASEFGEGTAVVLRLSQPFQGTRRTVVADSAFASVKTLLQLERRGLYFIGLVKTASVGYPKAALLAMVQHWSKTR